MLALKFLAWIKAIPTFRKKQEFSSIDTWHIVIKNLLWDRYIKKWLRRKKSGKMSLWLLSTERKWMSSVQDVNTSKKKVFDNSKNRWNEGEMKIKLSHTAIRTLVTFHLKGFCVDLQLPGESHLESIRRCPKWRLFSFLSFSLFIARSLSFPEGVNSPNAFSYLRENVQVRKGRREKNRK